RSDAGAEPLARRMDGARGARGPAADNENVERILGRDLLGRLRFSARVKLGKDLFKLHPALAEILPIEEDCRHGHHLASLDLALEEAAVDCRVRYARIDDAHQVQGLYDVGAILARERKIGLEMIVALKRANLVDHLGRDLGRMAPDLQQRQHERGKFVAERNAREAYRDFGVADAAYEEARAARIVVGALHADLGG